MINIFEVNETNKMIEQENLDVRTITMGISLLDCIDSDLDTCEPENLRQDHHNGKRPGSRPVMRFATEFGIPIVNKRISVTPIALVGGAACQTTGGFRDHCQNSGQSCQRQSASTSSAAILHLYPRE